MITDPVFYLVAIPAILVFAMSKGGVGGASAALAVPMMALFVDPLLAAAVMLPLLLLMDLTALSRFVKFCEWRHIRRMVPAALVGIVLAAMVMGKLSEQGMRLVIGLVGVLFCLYYLAEQLGWLMRLGSWRPGRWAGAFWSLLAGFASTHVHSGGIPASIYLYRQRLDRYQLTGTSAVFFTILNLVKLVPYTSLNLFSREILMTALVLAPLAPLGVLLARRLLPYIRESWYYPILYFFLLLASCRLVWVGLGA